MTVGRLPTFRELAALIQRAGMAGWSRELARLARAAGLAICVEKHYRRTPPGHFYVVPYCCPVCQRWMEVWPCLACRAEAARKSAGGG
ncbi:MAG: hypothetical protein JW809_10325 [Pirellulales bacterium]|nr:hypothetical protein [Pirellulales bacterium]